MDILDTIQSEKNREKVKDHLIDLLPNINTQKFILAGGLAIRYHLALHDTHPDPREFNDIDALIKSPSDLKSAVNQKFLIYHYHLYPEPQKYLDEFFIALIHPESKTKIDLFDYRMYPPTDLIKVSFQEIKLKMRSLENQLVTMLLEAARLLDGANNTPEKKITDIKLLLQYSDMDKFHDNWLKQPLNKYGPNPIKTWNRILHKIDKNPELVSKENKKKEPKRCLACNPPEEFARAPVEQIYNLMNW